MEFRSEDQHRAMMRSYAALKTHATDMGSLGVIGYEVSDFAREFFATCYHLKDWLKKDGRIASATIEQFVTGSVSLSLAGDIFNSLKHAGLSNPPKSGAPIIAINTALTLTMPLDAPPGTEVGKLEFRRNPRDGDTVTLGRAAVSRPIASASVFITLGTTRHDGLELATKCVVDWDGFLSQHGIAFTLEE